MGKGLEMQLILPVPGHSLVWLAKSNHQPVRAMSQSVGKVEGLSRILWTNLLAAQHQRWLGACPIRWNSGLLVHTLTYFDQWRTFLNRSTHQIVRAGRILARESPHLGQGCPDKDTSALRARMSNQRHQCSPWARMPENMASVLSAVDWELTV